MSPATARGLCPCPQGRSMSSPHLRDTAPSHSRLRRGTRRGGTRSPLQCPWEGVYVRPSPPQRPCQWPGQGGVARRGLGAAHCGSGEYRRQPQFQTWPFPPAPSAVPMPPDARALGMRRGRGLLSELRAPHTARTPRGVGTAGATVCASQAQLARLPRASQELADELVRRECAHQPRRDQEGLPGWKATRRGSGDVRSGGRVRLISQEIRGWEGAPSAVAVRVLGDAGPLCRPSGGPQPLKAIAAPERSDEASTGTAPWSAAQHAAG